MNLRDLQYVAAVAHHKNFTRASRAVHVSQPALSNQIKKLEAELGVQIFERTRNEVLLTKFGEQIVDMALEINGLVDRISETAQEHRKLEATPFRLGMTPTLAAYLSGYFLDMTAELFPDLKLVIVEEKPLELSRMVEQMQLDAALISRNSHTMIYGDAGEEAPQFTALWQEPLYLGMRKDHVLANKDGIRAKEVPAEYLIRFDVPFGYDLEKDLPASSSDAAERLGIDVRSARFETLCRHLAHTDACTIVNAIAAEQFKRDNLGLTFVPFDDAGRLRELGAITRRRYSRFGVISSIRAFIAQSPPCGTIGAAAGMSRSPVESGVAAL
ncbi:LysR family transcriptional regulator [Roseibium sp. HPY-6]|uniref:LysR family transcriptional regulator n=1 Tax=Roseibium sp. HPY-6 TaxID=3229852 RepID=UPI0033906750